MHVRLGNLALLTLTIGSLTSCSNQRGASTANLPKPSERMAALTQEAAVPRDVLRIGSWNLAWLGPSNHSPAERRQAEDLAQYIARSGAGIISFQLVGETDGYPNKNATLNNVVRILYSEGQGDWEYVLFPSQYKDRSDFTGILWNKRLVWPVAQAYAINVPRNQKALDDTLLWERLPYAMKFSTGKNDFVLIPVHTHSSALPDADISHRVHEVRLLAGQLDDVRKHFDDKDIILAGDFNTSGSNETTVVILEKQNLRDANSSDELTYISGAPFDRIFVSKDQPEFPKTQQIKRVPWPGISLDEFRRRLSDHYLITLDMRITGDDD
jgi:hypothetical protein